MTFAKGSMLKKILFSTFPILLGAFFVSWTIEQMASKRDSELERAIHMVNLVSQAELEMVKMSEALRGYLLVPENENEYKRKKAADEAYAERAAELSELSKDAAEIVELNDKMAKYDATDLDRIENEVGELIQKHDPKALEFYIKTYAPARELQSTNFIKLKELVLAHSKKIIDAIDAKRVANARITIFLLMLSVFSGLAIMIWIIKSLVSKINQISHSISGNVTEVDGVANSMADTSKRLSESTTEQAASLQETAASLEQITAMVAKASESAKQSAESSLQTQEKAQVGKEAMNTMMVSIDEISSGNIAIMDQVKNSNEQMAQVIEVIKEIGNKTKVINEIVFQTKLLSFNASVEAARAGEHGKGFAVVAEEVGSLAQMSGNAAKEISDMLDVSINKVEGIVNESRTKVQGLMEESKDKVERGVDIAKQCSESLDEIVSNVDRVSELAREISNATKEQSQGLAEISKAMSQLDSATQANASTSEEAAKSADSLTGQTESLRLSVHSLMEAIMGVGNSAETHQAHKDEEPQFKRPKLKVVA